MNTHVKIHLASGAVVGAFVVITAIQTAQLKRLQNTLEAERAGQAVWVRLFKKGVETMTTAQQLALLRVIDEDCKFLNIVQNY